MRAGYLLGLFFVSGLAGLAYQIAWSRMLGFGVGHEMAAVLATLEAIFGGMALGAWLGDRFPEKDPRQSRGYAKLELLIGIWGLITIVLIPASNGVARSLIGLDPSPWHQWLVVLCVPCITLLPATVALGATFPAMERLVGALQESGHSVAALYAANTLGAVAGVGLSTWRIIPSLGFRSSLVVFSSISIACGVLAWLVPLGAPLVKEKSPEALPSFRPRKRLAIQLFVTGLLGIGFEVLGIRLLAQVLENTIYSYAAALSVYLLGTALGAASYSWVRRRFPPAHLTSGLLTGLSAACLFGGWAFTKTASLYDVLRASFGAGLSALWFAEVGTAALVFFIPTVAMGALCGHLLQQARTEGFGVGRAVALNTLGAAAAPVVFGILLLPHLGARWAIAVVSIGYLTLSPGLQRFILSTSVATVLAVVVLPAELRFVTIPPGARVVSFHEGTMDSVAVIKHADGNRSLLVNNRFTMGGTGAAMAERRHATLPLLLHPAPKQALFLGLGTGISFAGATVQPGLRAEGVELLPEIVDALPWFKPFNDLPQEGNRFRIIVADGRRLVRSSDAREDVIVADLFHPARDGAGALYSVEHFRAVRARLAAGGLFCQWLPLFQLESSTLRVIMKTFLTVFPETRAFLLRFNVDTPVLGLIGTLEPEYVAPDYFGRRTQDAALLAELNAEQLRDDLHFFGCFLAGSKALDQYTQGSALNTDDKPIVLFQAPHFVAQPETTSYGCLLELLGVFAPDGGGLIDPANSTESARAWAQQLTQFMQARDLYLRGLVAEALHQESEAVDRFLESAARSVAFTTSYAQCLSLAMQKAKSDPAAARQLLERLAQAQPGRPVAAQLLERLSASERRNNELQK